MANILTADEAAEIVSVDPADARLLMILPQIDSIIQQATGHDWSQDYIVHPIAKRAAMCRLAVDYDLGALNPQQTATMERAYTSALAQLESLDLGMDALAYVNTAQSAQDMTVYLVSDALGLNLLDYNRLFPGGKQQVAQAVLDARPVSGYADVPSIQSALDVAVKAVIG